jgi:hypothetical protein
VRRREFLTTVTPDGDYVLSPTGLTWTVRRSTGDGAGWSVAVGVRDRATALAAMLALAATDKTDAWETVGTGFSWLVGRHRATA